MCDLMVLIWRKAIFSARQLLYLTDERIFKTVRKIFATAKQYAWQQCGFEKIQVIINPDTASAAQLAQNSILAALPENLRVFLLKHYMSCGGHGRQQLALILINNGVARIPPTCQ
ncbi:MAG TPA: hypothetical protein VG890_07320 [Puia sp.]|nr:hypothetical protein [Puia sp.]